MTTLQIIGIFIGAWIACWIFNMFISAIVDGPTTKFDNKYNAALLMIAPFMTGMLIIVF